MSEPERIMVPNVFVPLFVYKRNSIQEECDWKIFKNAKNKLLWKLLRWCVFFSFCFPVYSLGIKYYMIACQFMTAKLTKIDGIC